MRSYLTSLWVFGVLPVRRNRRRADDHKDPGFDISGYPRKMQSMTRTQEQKQVIHNRREAQGMRKKLADGRSRG